MFLITTADQQFWRTDGPALFLGEWCKLYDQRHVWQAMDFETLPYHWDDRSRLLSDHRYLTGVYEKYLEALGPKLNEIHGINQSNRFWRIVVGPWLRYFVEIFYDRYLSISEAAERGCVTDMLLAATEGFRPPSDFAEFVHWFISDSYNQHLYGWLVQKINRLPFQIGPTVDLATDTFTRQRDLKTRIARVLSRRAWRRNRIVLSEMRFAPSELLQLARALGESPWFANPDVGVQSFTVNPSLRQRLTLQLGHSPFEKLLDGIIPDQIPIVHVEAFADLRAGALNAFPPNPGKILTGTGDTNDEGFKLWAAACADKGITFSIAQHGGFFGSGLWMATEDHQIKISDRFYSWGWCDERLPSIKPMPAPKLVRIEQHILYSNTRRILWVLTSMPRYSYRMLSMPVAGQFLNYLDDQFRLAKALSPEIRSRITVRLYPDVYGWGEELRWRDHFPDIEIGRSDTRLEKELSRSSLLIDTYNATTFLETLAADFPTIVFWNPHYWELRPSAQPFYDLLGEAGIFHSTPESAALKVREVWNNPMAWWKTAKVQEARQQFCKHFAHTSRDWLHEWRAELKESL